MNINRNVDNLKPGNKIVIKCNTLKHNDENRLNRASVARKARFLQKINNYYLVEILQMGKAIYKECVWKDSILGVISK